MSRGAAGSSSAAALMFVLGAGEARANGAFPSSGQIVVDPADAARVGVRTSYGLVSTTDAGATFHWSCEAALGFTSSSHPQLGITSSGVVFGGLLDGMVRGRLGTCTWQRVAALEGLLVTDVSFSPGSGRAIAAVVPTPGARGEVWASDDDATSWARLGDALPVKLTPLTLDAAPSDPQRLYVSGLVDGAEVRGGVATSHDGGAAWTLAFVPDADASKAPYIGGVDPHDADIVWVRLDAAPGELFVSRDAGRTWELALMTDGFLRAFALSPDGSQVIAGGDADGLVRADAETLAWAPLSAVAARCVRWRDEAIDVCGTEAIDGFTMGRSTDGGASFEPIFRQACLIGPEPCEEGTPVAACADAWPAVRAQIGADGCGGGDGGAATTSGSTGAADATGGANAPRDPSLVGAGADGGAGGGAASSASPNDTGAGCSCRSTPSDGTASIATLIGIASATWAAARARSRTSRRHRPGARRR